MGRDSDPKLSPDEVYEEMDVLEPYTTGELASIFDAPKWRIRELLERLTDENKIRKKAPEPDQAIWIHDGPIYECPDCEYRYEVKFLHPMLSAVQFCPRCGGRL
jgi:transcription initiation factor IIE alpha subunit